MAFWRKDKEEKDLKDSQDPSGFIVKKEYAKAVQAYRAQIAAQPNNYVLNQKVADVLCMAGKDRDALADYSIAADGYSREGFFIKAIAILKKMQKIDPGNTTIESRLNTLAKSGASSPSIAVPQAAPPSPDGAVGGDELSLDMEVLDDSPTIPVAAEDQGPPTASRMAVTPLFSELQPDELQGVVARLRHRSFPTGSVLVSEGDPGDSLFVLSQGRVKVTTRGPNAKPVDLAELKEGDFFGEVSLLTGKPRTATIVSIEDTEVLELTRDDLQTLEESHPRVREVIKEFYERRVASTVESMIKAARAPKKPGKR